MHKTPDKLYVIDVKMWGLALNRMPKLDLPQWQALDPIAKWLVATRASVLFMTLTAAMLGGMMAWRDGLMHWQPFLTCTLGLLFAHATNNLLNDYTDSRRGIDKNNYYRNQYGVHVLEDGLMSRLQFWCYFAVTAGIALALGAMLISQRGGLTLDLMAAGAFFVLFYTWPLKYYGLGEPAVLLVWGPLMVGGTYYVTAAQWSWDVTWLSVLFALGPTTVLFGKHIDKLDADQAKNVRTLPVILGELLARHCVVAMLVGQYVLSLTLVLAGSVHWALLIVLLNIPNLVRVSLVYRQSKPPARPEGYPQEIWPLWFSAHAFQHTRRFTALFLLGLSLDLLLY
jgi:1,4-dihydroxy-2-naphthoate polyprenyltransferase